jgi:hypothetical protein
MPGIRSGLTVLLFVFVASQYGAPHEYSTHEHVDSDREQLGFGEESAGTWEEIQAKAAVHFGQIDTNGDGLLDFQEIHSRFSAHVDTKHHEKAKRQLDSMSN